MLQYFKLPVFGIYIELKLLCYPNLGYTKGFDSCSLCFSDH